MLAELGLEPTTPGLTACVAIYNHKIEIKFQYRPLSFLYKHICTSPQLTYHFILPIFKRDKEKLLLVVFFVGHIKYILKRSHM